MFVMWEKTGSTGTNCMIKGEMYNLNIDSQLRMEPGLKELWGSSGTSYTIVLLTCVPLAITIVCMGMLIKHIYTIHMPSASLLCYISAAVLRK